MQIPPHSVRYYTSLLAPMWVSATLCMSFMYYYMATQMEQLNYLSNNGNIAPLQTAFSVLLPLWGFISNFPLSVLLAKRSSIWLAWSVLAFGAISWTVCSIIPVLNLQCVTPKLLADILRYITFLIFIPWRLLLFSTLYSTVKHFVRKVQSA